MKYETEIREIISTVLDGLEAVNDISCDTNLQDIGMDSLAFVEIIIEMEELFNIEIPVENLVLSESGSIASLCRIVESAINDDRRE